MNKIKYKCIVLLIIMILLSNIYYANDGGEYYWGPEGVYTDVEEKIVNIKDKYIKVYKGAGENFSIDEKAKIPNEAEVSVYATITNGNTKWSLIKYYYNTNNILDFIVDEDGNYIDDEKEALEYYNKLNPLKQYQLLIDEYGHAGKDFGWVKDKFLISKKELEEKKQQEYQEIFESVMQEITSSNEAKEKETKESIIDKEESEKVDSYKKENIFDIIKKFFGIKK